MAIVNPSFDDAGEAPGLAKGWVIFSFCQAERWAAFGPSPFTAYENFERWSSLRRDFGADNLVVAFFGADGRESFLRGWGTDIFQIELSEALSVRKRFDAQEQDAERFDNGLVLRSSWSAVVAQSASFVGGILGRESFEGAWLNDNFRSSWSAVSSATALFGSAAAETFAGAWPDAVTL